VILQSAPGTLRISDLAFLDQNFEVSHTLPAY
jgi:hypothetical protein